MRSESIDNDARNGRCGTAVASFDHIMRGVREVADRGPRPGGDDGAPPVRCHDMVVQPKEGALQPRLAVLGVGSPRGARGGAERLTEGLVAALNRHGAGAELVTVTSDESSFDGIFAAYLRSYDLDLSAFDGVISTKAPSYAVRHRNHVCYLLHTMRMFYDMFDDAFADPAADVLAQRDAVRRIDSAALARLSLRGLFVVGQEVRDRLWTFNGVASEVLHHPTSLAGLHTGASRHLLVPGRLHPWKRVGLALRAVREMRHEIDLVVTGTGEEEDRLRTEAAGIRGVRFVGHIDDDALAQLYADALAVVYCPVREDYGLVTVEAFASGKPVVTCRDSGEPARIVADGVNGFVCAPDARALAERLDWLVENPTAATEMGRLGAEAVADIGWERVCARLLGTLGFAATAR